AQGGGAADNKAGWRGNSIFPYLQAPVSFKRLLGGSRPSRPHVEVPEYRHSKKIAEEEDNRPQRLLIRPDSIGAKQVDEAERHQQSYQEQDYEMRPQDRLKLMAELLGLSPASCSG